MKFGISGVNLSTNAEHFSDVISVIQYAEELGYDAAWLSDRLRDTYVNLTAVALSTRRIRLSTGMINPYTRHPVINARAVASVDEVSGGRMTMGFAAGNHVEMTKDMGFETAGGYARVREACTIIRRLFAGETVTFQGKYFKITDVKLGLRPRQIPIFIAGQGPKIMEVAGEVADAAIIPYTDSRVIDRAKASLGVGAGRAGRNADSIRLVSWLPTYVTSEKQKVLDTLRGYGALMTLLSPPEWMHSFGMSSDTYEIIKKGYAKGAHVDPKLEAEYVKRAKENVSDDVVQLFTIVGTSQEVNNKVEELRKQGFGEYSLWVPTPVLPEKRRVLETFANEVMVRFRD